MLVWRCEEDCEVLQCVCVCVIIGLCGFLQVIMRDHTSSVHVEELLRQSQMELQWIQRQLALIAARNIHHHHLHAKGKVLWYHIL